VLSHSISDGVLPPHSKAAAAAVGIISSPFSKGNVIKLSIRALILEGPLFQNLPGHLPETFHSHLHKAIKSFRKGVQGENPFEKGFSP